MLIADVFAKGQMIVWSGLHLRVIWGECQSVTSGTEVNYERKGKKRASICDVSGYLRRFSRGWEASAARSSRDALRLQEKVKTRQRCIACFSREPHWEVAALRGASEKPTKACERRQCELLPRLESTDSSPLINLLAAWANLQGSELCNMGEVKKEERRHLAPFSTMGFLFAADVNWGEWGRSKKKALTLSSNFWLFNGAGCFNCGIETVYNLSWL